MASWLAGFKWFGVGLELELGTFLALMNIMKGNGDNFALCYKEYLFMQDQFPAMWRIVRYMNHPTDVAKRKTANRKRRARGEEMRKALREAWERDPRDLGPGTVIVDRLPILVENISFSYVEKLTTKEKLIDSVFERASYEFQQGTLVAITDAPSCVHERITHMR